MEPTNPIDSKPNYPPPVYSPPGQSPPPIPFANKDNLNPSLAPPTLLGEDVSGHAGIQQQPVSVYATAFIQEPRFEPYPMEFNCPNCNTHILTETHTRPGLLTSLFACTLCMAGGLICALIPLCFRQCKDVAHKCPNCHHHLGLFQRIRIDLR